MQDLGRLAATCCCSTRRSSRFVALPDAFTTGSSIMPQKRNPDVFELVRGRSATAQACLIEALGIFAKLPSGYQRDLQLLKLPLFRGIDLCARRLDIMAAALGQMRISTRQTSSSIRRSTPPNEANALVAEGRHSVPRSLPAGRRTAETAPLTGRGGIFAAMDNSPTARPSRSIPASSPARTLIYALHAASIVIGLLSSAFIVTAFVFGLPSIVAVVMNYLKRSDVRGTWLESHFRWQIRTFWIALGAVCSSSRSCSARCR